MGLANSPRCRHSEEDQETVSHRLFHYQATTAKRQKGEFPGNTGHSPYEVNYPIGGTAGDTCRAVEKHKAQREYPGAQCLNKPNRRQTKDCISCTIENVLKCQIH